MAEIDAALQKRLGAGDISSLQTKYGFECHATHSGKTEEKASTRLVCYRQLGDDLRYHERGTYTQVGGLWTHDSHHFFAWRIFMRDTEHSQTTIELYDRNLNGLIDQGDKIFFSRVDTNTGNNPAVSIEIMDDTPLSWQGLAVELGIDPRDFPSEDPIAFIWASYQSALQAAGLLSE